MAASPFRLLLAFLVLSTAAAHSQDLHLKHHGHGPHPHFDRSSPSTARLHTASSMHEKRMESESESESEEIRQSQRVLNRFFTTVPAQASSGEDAMATIGAAADAGDTTARLDLPSPPPSLAAARAGNLVSSSLAPLQAQAQESGSSASEPAASPPVVAEPFRFRVVASTPPPPPPVVYEPYRDAAPPVHDDSARVVSSDTGDDLGLQQIAKVLASLGYNEMASSATLLADSTPVVTWSGAITVFGAPDVFLQHPCPECSRRHLILDHMALGYYPYAELAAASARKLPSASVGLCLDVAAQPQRGPFSVHHAILYVHDVVVSEPDLYDDGRYVVHGLHGFIPPLSHSSCVDGAHAHPHRQVHLHHYRRHHHPSARSEANSAATAASVKRNMIREAISRLRNSGFGIVALAIRVKFPELEKLSNLTVFALDDQIILTRGGHGYVSAVRFHIVPGHRLARVDLLRLCPGTVLPTLAGEDQRLVITLGVGLGSATDEVLINFVPVKEPDVVINSRVAVHGIYLPFPRLRLADSVPVASDLQTNDSCGVGGPSIDCADNGHGESSPGEKHARPRPVASAARPRHPSALGPHAHGFYTSYKLGHAAGRHGSSSSSAPGAAVAGLAGFAAVAAVAMNQRRKQRRKMQKKAKQMKRRLQKFTKKPKDCSVDCSKQKTWRSSQCGITFCNKCVVSGFLKTHVLATCKTSKLFCEDPRCCLEALQAPELDTIDGSCFLTTEQKHGDKITKTFVNLEELLSGKPPSRLFMTFRDKTLLTWWRAPAARFSSL